MKNLKPIIIIIIYFSEMLKFNIYCDDIKEKYVLTNFKMYTNIVTIKGVK